MIFLTDDNNEQFAINPEAILSVTEYDNDGTDMRLIKTSFGTHFIVRETMQEIVTLMDDDGVHTYGSK
jgi:uncharacterized protein YlzI (FlbEa/FlbD family)